MRIDKQRITAHNDANLAKHQQRFSFIKSEVDNVESVIKKLIDFQVAIPSHLLTQTADAQLPLGTKSGVIPLR